MISLSRALLGHFAILCLTGSSALAVDVPASSAVAGPVGVPSGGLNGEYWKRPTWTIATDGNSVPANRIDTQINGFGSPSGTFRATTFMYLGNDLSAVVPWLGSDGASFAGTPSNLDDGAFRFSGFINITAPGPLNIGANTDDGSRIKIGGVDVVANDGGHGDTTVSADANFLAAGLYPIEITFFNGDWTSDGNNHTGNPDPGAHGGANFRLLIGGANITPAQVATLFQEAQPRLLPRVVNIGQNKVGSVSNNADSSITIVGGGNDIWDQRDEFTFTYTEVIGDFDVQVRVESLQPNGANSKAGIMARESLSEFSRMAFPRVTPNLPPGTDNVRFSYRTGLDNVNGVNGGSHEDGAGASGLSTSNGWLRLARIGNTLYSSNSTDGATWTLLGSQDTTTWGGGALSNKLFLGLGVTRNGAGPTATAVFRDLQFNSNAAPFAVVSASSRGNPNGVRVSFNNAAGTGAFVPGNYTLGTISGPNVTAPVTGMRFSTANDATERDPLTFTLEGTVGDPASGPWTLIASGNTGLQPILTRNTQGPIVPFANANGYSSYRVLFPTVRDAVSANSMQIAEVEFLDAGGNDVTAPGDPVIPTSANSPGAEMSPLAIDNNVGTKYLNFDKLNTGFTVTPSGGALPSDPTVTIAAAGPNSSEVQLTTSGLVEGATYELTVANVQGSDGGALTSGTFTFVHGAGYGAQRIRISHNKTSDGGYYRLSDAVAKGIGDVVKMADAAVFPPYQTNTVFEDPIPDTGSNERFSSRISGVLNITTSGNYTFYMSSDDTGYLYLSTDESPGNKVQIASEPAWNGVRQYIAGGNQSSRGSPPSNISAPQSLQAGKKYYLELIFTEGGGGNNGSATWLPPGGPAVANGSSPIPESAFTPSRLLDGNTFRTLGPVQIVSQPTNQTVTALLPVTFRAAYDGTPGYTFQWRRNGQPIAGATGPSYTIPAAQLTDDQTSYSVVVANEFSSATSSNAVLTVLVPSPPHLVRASADNTLTTVFLDFDNRLENASATNTVNYSITNNSGSVAIASATRDATARRVVLRTATALAEDTTYTVTVSDIHDETGTTTLEPNPTNATFTTLAFVSGLIMREFYPQFSGGNVDPFVAAVRAGTVSPTKICLTNTYEYNNGDIGLQGGQSDNYGGRMLGYFVPTTTGNHVFYFATDDPGRLFLSTDANPANVSRIAIEPNWAARRAWVGESGDANVPRNGTNISAAINLIAGQRYYIESYFTEGGGGDHMAVAVQGPGDPIPANGSSPISAINLGAFVQAGNLVITSQPQSQTNFANGFATFTVGAGSDSAICGGGLAYQWYSNGVAVLGANDPSFTTAALSTNDSGTVYSVVITAPARSVTSSNALLTVVGDTTGPSLTSVRADGSFTNIFLTYSERIDSGSANETGNYTIKDSALNQIFVTAVITNANGSNVTLIVEPMQENTVYDLQIDFQADLAGNVSVPDPITTTFRTWVRGCPGGGLLWEAFNNIGGTAIVGMTSDPDFPNNPDERRTLASFDTRAEFATDNLRENFGARLRGLFIPPVSGRYIFYLHSDDAGQVFLNTNGPTDVGKQMIVEELGCCRDWPAVASAPIQLTGGRAYYIEGLYKEAGGGDYIRVAARLQGSTDPLAAISGDQLGAVAPLGAAGNITITRQPANTNASENTTATFSVAAQPEFAQPVCYQWQRDIGAGFVDIAGATGPSYSFIATLADEGNYRVRVGIIGNSVLSSNAFLDVVNDVTAPTVLSARGSRTLDSIIIRFSERMAAASAQEPGNYTLTDTNGAAITLGTPVLSADAMTVTIPTPPQAPGSIYNLSIAAITDLSAAGNQSAPTNFTFQTFIWSRGFATADYFFGIGGVLVSDLTNNAAYPNNPTLTEYVSLLEQRNNFGAGVNAQENYGSHVYGRLIAPRTANYNFYATSDDNSALYLSTDASPANNVLIASEPGWNGEREFINGSNQASRGTPPANRSTTLFPAGIALTASNTYYIELIAKEGGGGDNSSVAYEYPGSARVVNGTLPIHGTHLQALADPVGAVITITEQTTYKILTSTNLQHGQRALISVTAVGTNVNGNAPVVYQWQRSDNGGPWYDLNGANGNTFIAPVAAGKIADYRALIFIPGAQATSAPVHLVGEMVLRWTDPGVLQQAPTVTGPWTDIVPAAVSPYLIDTTDPAYQPMRFFRLRPAP